MHGSAPHEPPPPRPSPDDDEVLDAGQEEVFSRAEVELGRIEHATEAGKSEPPSPKGKDR